MKELIIEQKAKAYDEAIERVKNIKTGKCETTFMFTKGLLEHIFPELAESEGEKTKRLLHTIANKMSQHLLDIFTEEEFQCFDAWSNAWLEKQDDANKEYWRGYREGKQEILDKYAELEKQGEQKPILDVEIPFGTDSELVEEAITIPDGCYAIIEGNKVILRKGEKKSSWSEEDEENLKWFEKFFRAESVISGGKDIPQDRYLWFKNLKDRVQPKNEWSEEDEMQLDAAIHLVSSTGHIETTNWLKSLKSRVGCKVNCTTARKWSGEDEELCEHLIKGIEELDPLPTSIYSDCKKWLKSLKERVQPKQEWSEEDIATISRVTSIVKWVACSDHSHPILNDEGATELVERLKSIKDRVLQQNITVTDEELAKAKKDAYNDALDKIEYHSGETTFDDGWSAAIWYLKKKNARPQSIWKPSDRQMKAIEHICDGNYNVDLDILDSIYKDFKKLREE